MKDGTIIETTCVYPTGAPQKPMALDAVRTKFETLTNWPDAVEVDRLSNWTLAQSIQSVLRPFEKAPVDGGGKSGDNPQAGSKTL